MIDQVADDLMFPYPPVGFFFDVRIISDAGTQDIKSIGNDPKKALKGAAKVASEAGFQEVSGLSAEISTETISEGGENNFVYKVPKSVQYPNLVLKRGLATKYSDLVLWCEKTIQQESVGMPMVEPRMVLLTLLDTRRMPLAAWKFERAYPVKYEAAGFNAENNQLIIETIELAYLRFERVQTEASAIANTGLGAAGSLGANVSPAGLGSLG